MNSKYEKIYELWYENAQHISKSPSNWISFLKTISWNYKFSFEDQLLIYAQRPNATACASYEVWNNKLSRWIKRGSKGIALLDKNQSIRYVFDIADTRSAFNRPLHLWNVNKNDESEYISFLQEKYDISAESNTLSDTVFEFTNIIVEDNYQDYFLSLLKYREESSLENIEETELRTEFKTLISKSISFMILNRMGYDTTKYLQPEDFYFIRNFDTLDTIGQLGMTNHDLCMIAMKDISEKARQLMIRTFEKTNEISQNKSISNERSKYDEKSNIQSSRRLLNSPSTTGGNDLQQPLRKVEIQLPETKSSGTPVRIESEERAKQTPFDDSSSSNIPNGNVDETNVNQESSTRQGKKSDGMGAAHELPTRTGKRDNNEGNNLQLELSEVGGKDNTLPPFDMSDLPQLLREDMCLQHSREEIQQFFIEHTNNIERADFLESCYDDTLVQTYRKPENYDFTYLGYKKFGNKLNIWSGNYLNKKSESTLSFLDLQTEVAKLIERDEYLIPTWKKMTPIQRAFYIGVINRNVDYYMFSYNNEFLQTSSQIISYLNKEQDETKRISFIKGFYPENVIEMNVDGISIGFKKEEDHLHVYLGTYDNQRVSLDYSWKVVDNIISGMIISRYFDPSVQIPTSEEQKNAVFENEEQLKNGIYFSQEEIDAILTKGSGTYGGKLRIYHQMTRHETIEKNAKFLKDEYGTGGSSPAVGFISEDHDSKGILIQRGKEIGHDEIKITLSWKKVAKRIGELVALDRYLSPVEKKEYTQFLKNKMQEDLDKERIEIEKEKNGLTNDEQDEILSFKEYKWKVGDICYKGIDEYTILEDGENIAIQNNAFPLFIDYLSRKEFLSLLKENPLNEKFIVETELSDISFTEYPTIIEEYLPMLIEKIKHDSSYPALRDRDTEIDEAESLLHDAMVEILYTLEESDNKLYELFYNNEVFHDMIISNLIDSIYNDVSTKEIDNNLYDMFYSFVPELMEKKTAYMSFISPNENEHSLVIAYSDDKIIDMYHYFENPSELGVEVLEPHIRFQIDIPNKVLLPIYYSNPSMNIEFDLKKEYSDSYQKDSKRQIKPI